MKISQIMGAHSAQKIQRVNSNSYVSRPNLVNKADSVSFSGQYVEKPVNVDLETANYMFSYTNCDGIMIGRGSFGNPWIFEEIIKGIKLKKTCEDVKNMMLRHLKMLVEYKGEYTAIREMRKHIAWYIKGFTNATEIRRKVNQIENLEELKEIINDIRI